MNGLEILSLIVGLGLLVWGVFTLLAASHGYMGRESDVLAIYGFILMIIGLVTTILNAALPNENSYYFHSQEACIKRIEMTRDKDTQECIVFYKRVDKFD